MSPERLEKVAANDTMVTMSAFCHFVKMLFSSGTIGGSSGRSTPFSSDSELDIRRCSGKK
jgi:hypothetical protein